LKAKLFSAYVFEIDHKLADLDPKEISEKLKEDIKINLNFYISKLLDNLTIGILDETQV